MIGRIKNILSSHKILSLAGNFAASGFSFVSFFILARILSPDDLGIWIVFLTVAGFFDMFRAGLLRVALIRNIFSNEKKIVGSAWTLAFIITAFQIIVCVVLKYLLPSFVESSDLQIFVDYFPFLTIINLPYFFTFWIQQAKSRFDFILYSRILQAVPFTTFILISFFMYEVTLDKLAMAYIASFGLSSLVSLMFNWSLIGHIVHTSKETALELINFGKFSIGTVIGTNLLKSSDTLIINWMLGPAAVSFYTIPYKVLEIIEIPVRSIVATVLPKMSRSSSTGEPRYKIANLFKENVGSVTLLIIPVLIGCFIFAEQLVVIIGGEEYRETANILRIFTVYGLLLPADRFIGITLDAINRPQFNLKKILYMVSANIIFDVIALYIFKEVWAAATVTILTISIGVYFGHFFINRHVRIKLKEIIPHGWTYLKNTRNSI